MVPNQKNQLLALVGLGARCIWWKNSCSLFRNIGPSRFAGPWGVVATTKTNDLWALLRSSYFKVWLTEKWSTKHKKLHGDPQVTWLAAGVCFLGYFNKNDDSHWHHFSLALEGLRLYKENSLNQQSAGIRGKCAMKRAIRAIERSYQVFRGDFFDFLL